MKRVVSEALCSPTLAEKRLSGPFWRPGDEVSTLAQALPSAEAAALVLVDRSLDVITPLSPTNHPLDQIWNCLPRRASLGSPLAQ